jgi:hypothetical protein
MSEFAPGPRSCAFRSRRLTEAPSFTFSVSRVESRSASVRCWDQVEGTLPEPLQRHVLDLRVRFAKTSTALETSVCSGRSSERISST